MGFEGGGGGGGGGGGLEVLETGTIFVSSGNRYQVNLSNVTPQDAAFPAAWLQEGTTATGWTHLAHAAPNGISTYDVAYSLGYDGNDVWSLLFNSDSSAANLDLEWAIYALPNP